MSATPSYEIFRFAGGYVISLVGPGTLRESPAFQHFVIECLGQGCSVVADVTDCEYLDSTFLGCFIGLHKRALLCEAASFKVFADRGTRIRLFATSMLDRCLEFVDERPTVHGGRISLEFRKFDHRDLGRHVMNSHRELAELGGKDADKFAAIANRLQQELGSSSN
jgi:anti-anti-sigma regulatory factor